MENIFNFTIKAYVPGMIYNLGDKVIWNFLVYYSTIDNNSYSPSTGDVGLDSINSRLPGMGIVSLSAWSIL